MADLNKIIDELSKLTVVEAAELSKQLEENGSYSSGPVAAAPAGGEQHQPEKKNQNSLFSLHQLEIKKLTL